MKVRGFNKEIELNVILNLIEPIQIKMTLIFLNRGVIWNKMAFSNLVMLCINKKLIIIIN